MKRAAEAGASYWRIVALKVWGARQLDIISIIVVKLLPRRVRRWAVALHKETH